MSKRRRSLRTATPDALAPAASRTYIPDHVVLKPTDPAMADWSDDWTVFDLEDAVVLDKEGKRLENGLLVEFRGPLTVRGCLKIDRASKEHVICLQPNYKKADSVYIEIRDCQKYSIGQDENRPLIYLSGPCGWFEIEPSPEYSAMYLHMGQCADMYWSLARTYGIHMEPHELREWKRKNKTPPSVDEALFQYAVGVGDGSTKEDVLERCRQFAPFLSRHMSNSPDNEKAWSPTGIYQVLAEMAESQKGKEPYRPSPPPLDYTRPLPKPAPPLSPNRILKRTSIPASLPTRTRTRRSPVTKRESEELDTIISPPRAHTMATPIMATPTQPSATNDDPYQEGLDSLLAALAGYWVVDPSRQRSINGSQASICLYLYLLYSIKVYKGVPNLVAYYAQDILPFLDAQDANGGSRDALMPWCQSEFYQWVQQQAKREWEQCDFDPTPSPFVFRRRIRGNTIARPSTPAAKGTPGVGKGTPGVGKGTPGVGKGKLPRPTSGLRLSTAASKKRAAATELDSDDSRSQKQSKTSHYFDDGDTDMDNDHAAEEHDDGAAQGADNQDADDYDYMDDADANRGSVRVVIEVVRMPSITPRGPLGTWKCEFKGCEKYIRAFENQERLIQEHLQEHEGDPGAVSAIDLTAEDDAPPEDPDDTETPANADLIQLAVAEGKQSLLPINHLLDKIKRFGMQQEKTPVVMVNGEPVPIPAPIKRRLLY